MIELLLNTKITVLIIGIWLVMYLCNLKGELSKSLCGKGIKLLFKSKEFYRLLTGGLLHINIIHLLANASTMFWIGIFLESKIGCANFLTFYILGSFISSIVFYSIYSSAQSGVGASASVFSFIGLILILQLRNPDQLNFQLGTWYGNWIVLYSILGNILFLKFMNLSTMVAHIVGFMSGIILSLVFIFFGAL